MGLENYIGYWLFYAHRCTGYAFSEGLRQVCVEHGKPYVVTPPQWGVLSELYGKDGLTPGVISARLAQDAPTITGVVTRLEQNGLVKRVRDDKDRRIVKIYLTDEGRDITQLLIGAVEEMNEMMVRGFSEEEKSDLIAKLQRLVVNVASIGPGISNRVSLMPESICEQFAKHEDQLSE